MMNRGYLAVPRAFLFHVLPGLSDTELRVLLVVLVRTVGWVEQGKPKSRAWIARSVFVAETGRSADAITRATQSLINKGLLQVTNEQGKPVAARARSRLPRLYFEPILLRLGFEATTSTQIDRSPERVSDGSSVPGRSSAPGRVLKDAPNVRISLTTLGAQKTTQPGSSTASITHTQDADLVASIEQEASIEAEKQRIRERFSKIAPRR